VYYPATVEGADAQIDTVHGPYPIVAFGHGFFMQTGYYLSHFRHLATHGFVVIAPQFPDTQHGELADDLLYCVEYLRQQHSSSGSRFRGLIDTASIGLSGHSMGGGASLLAAARDSRVRVVAPLAAAETTPSAIAVMDQIVGFVYLIAGASDGIAPPAAHQIPMYNNANPPKALCNIREANHTRFMDVATFDFTDPNGTLTRPQQLLITRRYLTSVLSFVLKRDSSFWVYVFGDSARNDPRIIFSFALPTTSATDAHYPEGPARLQNYPNPFNPSTKISFHVTEVGAASLNVFDMLGREVATVVSQNMTPGSYEATFDAANLPSGAYIYRLQSGNRTDSKRMLLLK
jgi:dienelactone hydrolase